MRPSVVAVAFVLLLSACGDAQRSPASATPRRALVSQPFLLSAHCGILSTVFAGRTFYLEELSPTRIPALAMPEAGSMTLVSAHVAEFTDPAGNRIRFVDYLPGEMNHPYQLAVRVVSGGNHVLDVPFAGRHWQTKETLPGVVGAPYANGMDRVTFVQGVFIIVDSKDAIFRSGAGGVLHFSAVPPMGCD